MLRDHRAAAEREALLRRRYRRNVPVYGDWLQRMCPDWFGTISLAGALARNPDRALRELTRYFAELEEEAECPIAVVLAADRGRSSDRLHYHFLVSGVDHLSRKRWWRKAFERFGNTRIEPYDETRGGSYYVAQNALSPKGDWHFLGSWWDLQKKETK